MVSNISLLFPTKEDLAQSYPAPPTSDGSKDLEGLALMPSDAASPSKHLPGTPIPTVMGHSWPPKAAQGQSHAHLQKDLGLANPSVIMGAQHSLSHALACPPHITLDGGGGTQWQGQPDQWEGHPYVCPKGLPSSVATCHVTLAKSCLFLNLIFLLSWAG